jgi:hypothetical protein
VRCRRVRVVVHRDRTSARRAHAFPDAGHVDDPRGANRVATAHATAPRLTVSGITKTVTRKALAAGLRIRVRADEPIAATVALLVGSHRAAIARVHVPRADATGTVKLHPRRAPRGTQRMRAELLVIAYDRAGNRAAQRITFTIR